MALFVTAAAQFTGPFQAPPEFTVPYRRVKPHMDRGVLVLTAAAPQLLEDVVADGWGQGLIEAVSHAGARQVVFDLHEVKAICSAAIGSLLGLRDFVQRRGGRLVLCGLSPCVAEVLHIVHMTAEGRPAKLPFEVASDVEAAVACLQRANPPRPSVLAGANTRLLP